MAKLSSAMGRLSTFLCVDDEPSILRMEKMLLESAGYRVLTSSAAKEALKIFEAEDVDVVVMDYFMSDMTGIEAARMMKQLKPGVPLLFLSGYGELPDESLGLADTWVIKGQQRPEEFLARLRALALKSRPAGT